MLGVLSEPLLWCPLSLPPGAPGSMGRVSLSSRFGAAASVPPKPPDPLALCGRASLPGYKSPEKLLHVSVLTATSSLMSFSPPDILVFI